MLINLAKRAVRKSLSEGMRPVISDGLNMIPGGRLLKTEYGDWSQFEIPATKRVYLYKNGFLSYSHELYDFEANPMGDYVSDYARFIKTKKINGRWRSFLDNKLMFHYLLADHDSHRTAIFGVLGKNRVISIDQTGDVYAESPAEWIQAVVKREGRVVLKPVSGGGGKGILMVGDSTDTVTVNSEPLSFREFENLLRELDEHLICEYAEQAPYATNLYSETPNTIRIVTMIDPETGSPFIARAVQRIGTSQTGETDNFSRGGLSAMVDREKGTLSKAARFPSNTNEKIWYDEHPDSGSQINGVTIPNWELVRDRILDIANDLSFLPYVGWDVLVTDENGSFKVIEGNAYTDVDLLQVHKPLLNEDRVRRFYEHHGVI